MWRGRGGCVLAGQAVEVLEMFGLSRGCSMDLRTRAGISRSGNPEEERDGMCRRSAGAASMHIVLVTLGIDARSVWKPW